MFKNLRDLNFIFRASGIKDYNSIIILVLINSLFEFLSFGLLVPLVGSILNDNFLNKTYSLIFENNWLILPFFKNINQDNFLIFFTLLILILYVLKYSINLFFNFFLAQKKVLYEKKIGEKILKNLVTTSNFSFLNIPKSKVLQDITTRLGAVSSSIINAANLFVEIFILFLIVIFVNIGFGKNSAFFFCLIFLIFFIFYLFFRSRAIRWSFERGLGGDSRNKNLIDILEGIREIIVFGNFNNLMEEFKKNNDKFLDPVKKILFWGSVPRIFLEFIFFLCIIGSFIYYINFNLDKQEFIVYLSSSLVIIARVLPSANRLLYNYTQIKYSADPINSIKDILNLSSKNNLSSEILNFTKDIKIQNINFVYENKKIFEKLNLTINKNSKVAIIGDTGSGKTTLIDIIVGFKKSYEGELLVDSKQISINNSKEWIKNIAYLSQRVYLFNSSIRNNITFASDDGKINEEKFNEIIKIVDLESMISAKRKKEFFNVGEFGNKISGGQRQKIGIARALYSDRPIIILDESTNSLDNIAEKNIIENVLKIKNKTIIMITHNIKNVELFEKIYKLENKKLNQTK